MFFVHDEPQAESHGAFLFGRAGPESLVMVGVDSTIYLLSPGQGFLLPWGEYAWLANTSSGGVSIITPTDTITVSECAPGLEKWAWASPFHNPQLRREPPGDMTHPGRFPGHDPREAAESGEDGARAVWRDNRIPGESNGVTPADGNSIEAAIAAPFPDNAPLVTVKTDARLYPHPPVLHILGVRHTALVELWYRGSQAIYGIHLFLEPEGEIASIVSAQTVASEQEAFSLTYGQSPKGGLQIRLASETALADQPGPLLSVLLESRAPGTEWIRLERIVVATEDGLWSLPDDSLQVYIED